MNALTVNCQRKGTGRLGGHHLLGFGLETVGQTRHGAVAHRLQLVFAQQPRVLRHDAARLVLLVAAAAVRLLADGCGGGGGGGGGCGRGKTDRAVGTINLVPEIIKQLFLTSFFYRLHGKVSPRVYTGAIKSQNVSV